MKLKIFYSILFLLLFTQTKAQVSNSLDYKMPKIIGQTPDVASLLKFSETSVSYSTGIPNISIPIFTLPSGDLSASVGISYHAGGIRVTEDASSVGLGWSLFAGGQITRIVKSHPDEQGPNGYLYLPYTVDFVNNLCAYGLTDSQGRSCHFYTGQNAEGLRYDYEPDEFNYSMLGLSGTFMFNQDRTVNPIGEIVQFPHKNVEIIPIFGVNEITGWNITDNNGTLYHFQKGNTHYNTDYIQKVNGQVGFAESPEYTPQYIETWDLVSVRSHNGDLITFNYITPVLSDGFGGTLFNEHNFMESSDALVVQEGDNTAYTQPNNLPKRVNVYSNYKRKYTTLKSIVSPMGKIEIIYDTQPREDIQSEKYRIKFIELYDNHNKLLKRVELKHSYFDSDPPSQNSYFLIDSQWNQNTLIKRLCLDEVVFKGFISDSNPINDNSYSYNLVYNELKLPSKRSYAQDHWGYYNGASNISLIAAPNFSSVYMADREVDTLFSKARILKTIQFPEGGMTEFVFENNTEDSFDPLSPYITTNTIFHDGLNTPHTITQNGLETTYSFRKNFTIGNDAKPEDGSLLTQLNFNGSTTRCPNNTDEIFNTGNLVCNKILLKIYEMVNGQQGQLLYEDHIWAANHIIVNKNKEYRAVIEITSSSEENYDFNVHSSEANVSWLIDNPNEPETKYLGGLRIKDIKNRDKNQNLISHRAFKYKGGKILSKPSYFSVTTGNIRKFVSQSWVPLLTSQSGYVHYSEVEEEYIQNPDGNHHSIIINGQNAVIRKFTNSSPPTAFPGAPFVFDSYLGLLLEERIPNVSKKTNFYVSRVSQISQPVKGFVLQRPYFIDESISPFNNTMYEMYNCLLNNTCDITNNIYILNSVSRLLSKQKEESMFYDDYNLLHSVIQSKDFFYNSFNPNLNLLSKTVTHINEDIILEDNFKYAHDLGDQNLIASNRISSALESTSQKNGLMINKVKAAYNNFGVNYLVDNIKASKGDDSLEERLTYHQYNSLGRPIEISKADGTHIFYIYGYNSNYPIAEIKNFTSSEAFSIQGLINEAVSKSNLDDDTSNDNSGNEGQLRLALENIRNHPALSNAQITTYTYDPLVGITSVTDVRNFTTFYQYDNFGRLSYVRDYEGNILSENEYNYVNQN